MDVFFKKTIWKLVHMTPNKSTEPVFASSDYEKVYLIRQSIFQEILSPDPTKNEFHTLLNRIILLFQRPIGISMHRGDQKVSQTAIDHAHLKAFQDCYDSIESDITQYQVNIMNTPYSLVLYDIIEEKKLTYQAIPLSQINKNSAINLLVNLFPSVSVSDYLKIKLHFDFKDYLSTVLEQHHPKCLEGNVDEILKRQEYKSEIFLETPPKQNEEFLENISSILDLVYQRKICTSKIAQANKLKPANAIFYIKKYTRKTKRYIASKTNNGTSISYAYDIQIVMPPKQREDCLKGLKRIHEGTKNQEHFIIKLGNKKEKNRRYGVYAEMSEEERKKYQKLDNYFFEKISTEQGRNELMDFVCQPFGEHAISLCDNTMVSGFLSYSQSPFAKKDGGLMRTRFNLARIEEKNIKDYPDLIRKVTLHYLLSIMAPPSEDLITTTYPVHNSGTTNLCIMCAMDSQFASENDQDRLLNEHGNWCIGYLYYHSVFIPSVKLIRRELRQLYYRMIKDVYSRALKKFLDQNIEPTVKIFKSNYNQFGPEALLEDENVHKKQRMNLKEKLFEANDNYKSYARYFPQCYVLLESFLIDDLDTQKKNNSKKTIIPSSLPSFNIGLYNIQNFITVTFVKNPYFKHHNDMYDRFIEHEKIKTIFQYQTIELQNQHAIMIEKKEHGDIQTILAKIINQNK